MSYLYNLKKSDFMKTKILMLGMILSLMTISCSKKDNADNSTISADEAAINAKFDAANDDVSAIIEEQLDATMSSPSGRGPLTPPSCPTVTRTPTPIGTPLSIGDNVTETIDFGTGCLHNGHTLSGIIVITFTYNPGVYPQVATYTFNNFYHNLRKFTGTKTFTRTLVSNTVNTTPHYKVVMDMNMTMTTPDGRTFTRVGTRTREIIAGQNTPIDLTDNVYQVTGNWTTTYPNTTVQTSTITSPILVKFQCISGTNNYSPLSQGIITFVRNTHTATLDYGNGSCDNTAIFTLDGVAHTITLN